MDRIGMGRAAGRAARFWRVLPALAAVAALGACGKSTTGPSGPTRTVIGTQTGTLQPFTAGPHAVQANASGTIDVTLDWGNAANDFDIYITSNNCNTTNLADLEAGVGNCTHITDATSTNRKPESVTWSGNGGTTYKVWVANFGLSADSYTVTAGVTN